jgi:hypothetical protein
MMMMRRNMILCLSGRHEMDHQASHGASVERHAWFSYNGSRLVRGVFAY